MRKFLLVIPALLMTTGCGTSSPFGPAKTTLKWVKTGLNAGQLVQTTYLNYQEAECTKKDPLRGSIYDDCMATAEKVRAYWPVARATADRVIKTAEDAIADAEKKLLQEKVCEATNSDKNSKEYKDCVETYKADVMRHVKNAGCVVLTALDFLPDSWRANLQVWVDLLKGWACNSTAGAEPKIGGNS